MIDTVESWKGMHFYESIPGSEMRYCDVRHANNSGINISNYYPTISHCSNSEEDAAQGGGIAVTNSTHFSITECTISGNTSHGGNGGGIFVGSGIATISKCYITNNTITNPGESKFGGGLYVRVRP